jgi:non-heme chloroperoxidase
MLGIGGSRPEEERCPSYKQQKKNQGITEIVEMPNRGNALVIDNGWREVADKAVGFVQRFVK